MLIHTRTIGFPLTESIREYAESRVRSALMPFSRRVAHVMIRLEAVNGARGGRDMRCRIVASLCRRGIVIAQAVEEDLYVAIDVARTRLRRSASRAMATRPHRGARPVPAAEPVPAAA